MTIIVRQGWLGYATMAALHLVTGDPYKAECERVNVLGWLTETGNRSWVQA